MARNSVYTYFLLEECGLLVAGGCEIYPQEMTQLLPQHSISLLLLVTRSTENCPRNAKSRGQPVARS